MNSRNTLTNRVTAFAALLLILLLNGTALSQQQAARPDRGIVPGASYSISDTENISLSNGNLNLSIPLASLPPIAGGKLKFTLSAVYNSKLWNVTRFQHQLGPLDGCGNWTVNTPQLGDAGGWRIAAAYALMFREASDDFEYYRPQPYPPADPCGYSLQDQQLLQNRWYRPVVVTPDGAEHELRPVDSNSTYSGSTSSFLFNYYSQTPDTSHASMRYYSVDGSYIWAVVNPYGSSVQWTLYLNDGTSVIQYGDGTQRLRDTNGNSIKIFSDTEGAHIQDEQTGREIKVTYDPSGNNGQGQSHVLYKTVGGVGWQSIDINYGTTHVQGKVYPVNDWIMNGGETGTGNVCQHAALLDSYVPVIRGVVFPATEPGVAPRQYSFGYNADTTETASDTVQWACGMAPQAYTRQASVGLGDLNQMVTPTGATVTYAYSRDSEDSFAFDPDDMPRETVRQKSITHDGVTDTWHYNIAEFNACGGTVTGPDGSVITENCEPRDAARGSYSISLPKGGLVFRTNNSNKTVVERHWSLLKFTGANGGAAGNYGEMPFNPVVDAEYISLLDDTPNHTVIKMSAKTYQYDFNGNQLSETDYDWFDPTGISRDSDGVPTGVPAGAVALRTVTNTYYNDSSSASSGNVYAKRSLNTALPLILSAPRDTTLGSAVTRFSYDGQPFDAAPTVGNLTTKSLWDDVDSRWITTSSTYGLYGNLATVTDARSKVTTYDYANPANGLPTSVTVDPQNGTGVQTTSTVYDTYTGLVTSTTDPNNATSTIDYTNQLLGSVDPFGRPGVAISPPNVNGQHHRTRMFYADASRVVTTLADLNTEGDGVLKSKTITDQLGRTTETRQYESAVAYIAVRQSDDIVNRIHYTSNPFRGNDNAGPTESLLWTTTVSDTAGRVKTVTTPDTAVMTTDYYANTVTVTDQANKQRQSSSDALGRLTSVVEDPNGLNYQTTYDYDVFGNLRYVYQGAQPPRTFSYDSLSRLRSAQNPESGTVNYAYDDNGNLTSKTDARGIVSTYVYDAVNRNTSITYSDGTPTISRVYDSATNGKGRLYYQWTAAADASKNSLTAIDVYDSLGKPKNWRQHFWGSGTWGSPFNMAANYDLAGHVTSMSYPSGHTVTYAFDAAGRLNDFRGYLGDGGSRVYSTGISYSHFGGMSQEQFGTATPIFNKSFYNSRGQLAEIRAGLTPNNTTWERGAIINYYGPCWGMCGGENSTTPMPNNNGNLLQQEHWIQDANGNVVAINTEKFSYDSLNRLERVYDGDYNTPAWRQRYNYDRYGNRTIDQASTFGSGIPNPYFGVNQNTNQLTPASGYTMHYDAAGNLDNDNYTGLGQRVFDAENRMTAAQGGAGGQWQNYFYNPNGQRVKRIVNGVETWQIYGVRGELLAEYSANASASLPQKEYGYRNGQLLITATGPGYIAENRTNVSDASKNLLALAKIENLPWEKKANSNALSDSSTPLYGPMPQSLSKIAFASNREGSSQIYLMNTDGTGVMRLTNNASNDDAPRWSPNNSKIVFESDRDSSLCGIFDVYTMNADGSSQARLTTDANDDSAPVWSPDGTKIAFQSFRNGANYQVYVMNADGSGQTNISNSGLNDTQPSWSPDGTKIAFTRATATSSHVFVMSASGANQTQLTFTTDPLHDEQPVWSRDGLKLAFVSTRDSVIDTWQETDDYEIPDDDGQVFTKSRVKTNKEVYVMNTDGSNQIRLTNTLENDDAPSWSANGSQIVFRSDRERDAYDPSAQVWMMNSDGSGQINLSNNGGNDYSPDLQTSGTIGPPPSPTPTPTPLGPSPIGVHWLVADQLGTPRIIIDESGSLANVSRHDYLPYGEELFAGSRASQFGYIDNDGIRERFTQKEHDSETALDYFGARYYASSQGRFTCPDPVLSSGRIPQPQSWNRYSYVLNRPLSLVDPDGLDWGYATWQEDGRTVEEYRYFDGKIGKRGRFFKGNGRTYHAVRALAKGGSSLEIHAEDGTLVRIRNSGIVREVVGRWAPATVAIQGQENLNASAGLFDGAVPFGKELREGLLGKGGVDTDSPEYRNSAIISAAVVIIPGLLDGEGEVEAIGLSKQLASESQTAELLTGGGKAIIGSGTNKALFEAPRLAAEYGGEAADWAKITSPAFKAPDGAIIETHAYKNLSTGRIVEPKSVSSTFPGRQ
jgi:RHS repeat-associated protein